MLSEEELIEARHKLSAGRILATRKMPYFATALMAMSPHEREGLGTFAVDARWRMYYDPAKCLEWTVHEIAAAWLHEVGHVIRNHNERFKSLEGYDHDAQLFNAASDAAINSDLRDSDVLLPNPELRYYAEPNARFPQWKKGMTAEEMYFIGYKGNGKPHPEEENNAKGESDASSSEDSNESGEPQEVDGADSSDGLEDKAEEASQSGNSEESKSEEDTENDTEGSGSDTEDSDTDSENSSDEEEKSASGTGNNEDENDKSDDGEASFPEGAEGTQSASDAESTDENDSDSNEGESSSDREGNEGQESDESSGESGDSGNDGQDSSSQDGEASDSQSGDSEASSSAGPPMPDCGSAVDGEPRDYEETNDNDGSVDKTTAEALKKKTAEAILEYEKGNPGAVPGNLVREAENILDPQVDWRDEFAALTRHVAASHAGYTNYSYRRPSRRSSGSNFILPTMRNPPAPEIAIVLDTSGSMDEKRELALGLSEMEDIINRSARYSESQSIKIINCDSAAASVEVVRDLKDFQIVGGGGTDMRVGIKAASELKPKMDVIITVTDGFTPWPKEIPDDNDRAVYIALIVGRGEGRSNATYYSAVPAWMKVIEVNIPQKRKGYSIKR